MNGKVVLKSLLIQSLEPFKSALIGGISGVILMSWISFNSQWAIAVGHMNFPPKELASDQCYYNFEPSNSTIAQAPTEEFHPLFKISYMW